MPIKQHFMSPAAYQMKSSYGEMIPQFITIHNTANDASADSEINYMSRTDTGNNVSFHFAVDNKEVVQGLPLNRSAIHAGTREGNIKSIAIEICYSKSGGEKFDQAEVNAAKLTAQLLKERGWGLDRVKKHQDWSGKYCPHRTLDKGWDRFLGMVKQELTTGSVTDVQIEFREPFRVVAPEGLTIWRRHTPRQEGDGNTIDILSPGQEFWTTGETSDGWLRIEAGGWVEKAYTEPVNKPVAIAFQTIRPEGLTIWRRHTPQERGNINTIDVLQEGQMFNATGETTSGWLRIQSGGWVEKAYAKQIGDGQLPMVE